MIKVSYKTIERLCSDEEVKMALTNSSFFCLGRKKFQEIFQEMGMFIRLQSQSTTEAIQRRDVKTSDTYSIADIEGNFVGLGYSAKAKSFQNWFEWLMVIERIVQVEISEEAFKRNLSEAGFSADRRRFGWLIRQKRWRSESS